MIHVAICDDEPIYVDIIARAVEKFFQREGAEYEIDKYTSGKTILEDIREKQYEIILLDVQMPEISGYDVAQQIYHMTKGDNLIFVSSHEHLVCVCLDFRPIGFIRKRLLVEDMERVLRTWYERYTYFRCANIDLKTVSGDISVCLDDILYIESKAHYLYVHTNNLQYKVRGKLSDYDYLLERLEFVKCNTSYICNIKYIYTWDSKYVKLNNGMELSISRTCRDIVRKKCMHYRCYLSE